MSVKSNVTSTENLPTHGTLLGRFLAALPANLDLAAVVDPGRTVSYGQLLACVNARTERLAGLGICAGQRVALVLPRSADAIAYALAVMSLGAAYAHLDPADPPGRTQVLLEACQPSAIVGRAQCPPTALPMDHPRDSDWAGPAPQDWRPPSTPTDDDIAYVVHTSGTTGIPKTVQVPHSAIINLLDDIDARSGCLPPRVVSSWWTSPSFDLSVWESWSALIHGGCVCVVPDHVRLDADALVTFLAAHGVTSAFVPAAFLPATAAMLPRDPALWPTLTRMLVGVEPIPFELLAGIISARPALTIVNAYGPAEAAVACCVFVVDKATAAMQYARTPIGTAIAGNDIILVDETGNELTGEATGELVVVGRNVASYLNQPDSTSYRRWQGRPAYQTGDIVKRLPDGNLEFVGRRDRQIKIRGYRVEAAEVESGISAAAAVDRVYVRALDGPHGPCLVAFVTPAEGTVFDETAVRRSLAALLPPYALPTLYCVGPLPQTDAGKIDDGALTQRAFARLSAADLAGGSEPSLETAVRAAWTATTGAAPDGLSYVAAGGTSLGAIAMAADLRDRTGLVVDAAAILSAGTPAELTAALAATADPPGQGAVPGPARKAASDHVGAPNGSLRAVLSPGQTGLWLHQLAAQNEAAYAEGLCFRLPAAIDADRLDRAMALAAQRHPAFGARIADTKDVPELVLGGAAAGIEHASAGTAAEAVAAATRRVAGLGGPLFLGRIVETDDHGRVVTLSWHHLIVDDITVQLYLDTIGACYASPDAPATPSVLTICDHMREAADRQNRAGTLARARQVAGQIGPLLARGETIGAFPGDGRPASTGSVAFTVPPDDYQSLRAAWRRASVTPVAGWVGMLADALGRGRAVDQVVIGVPRSLRVTAQEHQLAGYCLDTALIAPRVGHGGMADADAAADAMRWLDLWLHPQSPSLSLLLQELRGAGHRRLQVPAIMFNLSAEPSLVLAGQRCPVLDVHPGEPKFPLSLTVQEGQDRAAQVRVLGGAGCMRMTGLDYRDVAERLRVAACSGAKGKSVISALSL